VGDVVRHLGGSFPERSHLSDPAFVERGAARRVALKPGAGVLIGQMRRGLRRLVIECGTPAVLEVTLRRGFLVAEQVKLLADPEPPRDSVGALQVVLGRLDALFAFEPDGKLNILLRDAFLFGEFVGFLHRGLGLRLRLEQRLKLALVVEQERLALLVAECFRCRLSAFTLLFALTLNRLGSGLRRFLAG